MTHQEARRTRILIIRKMIQEVNLAGLGYNEAKLIAKVSLEMGISKRTTQEYINCLLLTGKIIKINDELWIPQIKEKLENKQATMTEETIEQKNIE